MSGFLYWTLLVCEEKTTKTLKFNICKPLQWNFLCLFWLLFWHCPLPLFPLPPSISCSFGPNNSKAGDVVFLLFPLENVVNLLLFVPGLHLDFKLLVTSCWVWQSGLISVCLTVHLFGPCSISLPTKMLSKGGSAESFAEVKINNILSSTRLAHSSQKSIRLVRNDRPPSLVPGS